MPIACVTRPSACDTAHDSASATDKPGDSPERCPGPGSVSAGAPHALHACDARCRSRQPNTHNTEAREVRYSWHPWFGRSVVVYEMRVQQGHSVCRCGLEEEWNRQSIEIPSWMFDPATCGRFRVMAVAAVGCDALLVSRGTV